MSKRLDTMADELFKILPARSRAAIAEGLTLALDRDVPIWEVDQLLRYIRSNSQQFRWVPFYAPHGPNALGVDRYIIVLLDRDGTLHSSVEGTACSAGSVSALQTISSLSARLQVMVLAQAGRTPGRKLPRMLRAIAADLQFVERKIGDILEEYGDAA